MIRHHPNDETLGLYALGGLKTGARLVVGAHLSVCARCRAAVAGTEAVAGVMLETAETAALDPGALDRVLGRLGEPEAPKPKAVLLEDLVLKGWWLPAAPGLWFKPLPRQAGASEKLYLLKARGGTPLPEHGHNGCERLIVLDGDFRDGEAVYGAGDFAECDEDTIHTPVAKTTCICLAATDGPLRFKGLARWLQPLLGV